MSQRRRVTIPPQFLPSNASSLASTFSSALVCTCQLALFASPPCPLNRFNLPHQSLCISPLASSHPCTLPAHLVFAALSRPSLASKHCDFPFLPFEYYRASLKLLQSAGAGRICNRYCLRARFRRRLATYIDTGEERRRPNSADRRVQEEDRG